MTLQQVQDKTIVNSIEALLNSEYSDDSQLLASIKALLSWKYYPCTDEED